MSSPTWGDTVRIKKDASPELRPGSLAAVCGMKEVETAAQSEQFGCAIGTTLYLVEFGDGASVEIPEELVEVANDDVPGDAVRHRRVACPRCGQGWLVCVRLVHLCRNAILCPECDALWQQPKDLGPTTFEDYGTFMTRHGRETAEQKGEIEIEGEFMRESLP